MAVSPGEEKVSRNLINVWKYLMRGCKGDGPRLFSVLTRGSKHNARNSAVRHFVIVRMVKRLIREIVESQCLGILRNGLKMGFE